MRLSALLLAAAFSLSACGSSTGDRAASGAGIGATAGAVVGAVTGLSVLQGVVIGAVAGGVIGGVTDESTINLGDPIWAKGDKPANNAAVSRVQAGLTPPAMARSQCAASAARAPTHLTRSATRMVNKSLTINFEKPFMLAIV